jgi:hypothetical protein
MFTLANACETMRKRLNYTDLKTFKFSRNGYFLYTIRNME